MKQDGIDIVFDNSYHLPKELKKALKKLLNSALVVGIAHILVIMIISLLLGVMLDSGVVNNGFILAPLLILSLIAVVLSLIELKRDYYNFNKLYLLLTDKHSYYAVYGKDDDNE